MRALWTLLTWAFSTSAFAVVAASRDELLCQSAQVVVADVMSARSGDCWRERLSPCTPRNVGWLHVTVVEVLGVGDESKFRRFGMDIEGGNAVGQPYERTTTPVAAGQSIDVQIAVPAPFNAPLTDADVTQRFQGRRLLLSLSFMGGFLPLKDTGQERAAPIRLPPGSELSAELWRLEERDWVISTLTSHKGKGCPKLISVSAAPP